MAFIATGAVCLDYKIFQSLMSLKISRLSSIRGGSLLKTGRRMVLTESKWLAPSGKEPIWRLKDYTALSRLWRSFSSCSILYRSVFYIWLTVYTGSWSVLASFSWFSRAGHVSSSTSIETSSMISLRRLEKIDCMPCSIWEHYSFWRSGASAHTTMAVKNQTVSIFLNRAATDC